MYFVSLCPLAFIDRIGTPRCSCCDVLEVGLGSILRSLSGRSLNNLSDSGYAEALVFLRLQTLPSILSSACVRCRDACEGIKPLKYMSSYSTLYFDRANLKIKFLAVASGTIRQPGIINFQGFEVRTALLFHVLT
jgi:hypothetical protein